MSWCLFGQIVLLIIIYVFLKTLVMCLYDKFCKVCKKE